LQPSQPSQASYIIVSPTETIHQPSSYAAAATYDDEPREPDMPSTKASVIDEMSRIPATPIQNVRLIAQWKTHEMKAELQRRNVSFNPKGNK
jgi:hypothetical protein